MLRIPALVSVAMASLLVCLAPGRAEAVEPGDVVISELLVRSGAASEWIELYNASTVTADLSDCRLREENDEVALTGLSLAPGSFSLLSKGVDCVVFDSDQVCVQVSDFVYSTITLNDSEAQTLELICGTGTVIDDVTYDDRVFAAACTGAGSGTCSVNLDPAVMTEQGNDQWSENWCVPPATAFVYDELGLESVSTPRLVNQCASTEPGCNPGDVIFTEFMIDPPDTSDSIEWFELLVTSKSGCDLHGCVLWEGPFDEITADNLTSEEWSTHEIDAPGNTLPLVSGQYALFSESSASTVATAGDGSSQYSAVYNYSGLSFANSGSHWVHLLCAEATVDSAPYAWDEFAPACLGSSCSVNLSSTAEDAGSNDDFSHWCLPPLAPDWVSSHADGLTFLATPREPGACQSRAGPAVDELVFTELMVAPERHGGEGAPQFAEWFELYNPGTVDFELSGCRLLRERFDEAGDLVAENQATFLGNEVVQPVVTAGQAVVFSKGCLLSGDDPTDPEAVGCQPGEYTYASISLTDSTRESLSLLCPDGFGGEFVVDTAGYDMTRTGHRKGRTMQFDYSGPDESRDNADPFQWCEASLQQEIPAMQTDDGEFNYGSPGELVPCVVGQVELPTSGPGCRCDSGGASEFGPAGLGMLLMFALPLVRRRVR